MHKEILQAKRDESLKKINEDIRKFQLQSKPQTPQLKMQEDVINSSGVKDMPEEIKDHHLQMLGMKTSGRMDKKKVSVTQV